MPGPLAEPIKKKKPDEEIAPKTQQPAAKEPEKKKGMLASVGEKIKNFKENNAMVVRMLEGLALGAGAGLLLGPLAVPLGMLAGAVALGIYGKMEQNQKREENQKKLFTEPKKPPVENVDEKLLKELEKLKEQQPEHKGEAEEVKRDDEAIKEERRRRKEEKRQRKAEGRKRRANQDVQRQQKNEGDAGDKRAQQRKEDSDDISASELDDGPVREEVQRAVEDLGDAITSAETPEVKEDRTRLKETGRGQGI